MQRTGRRALVTICLLFGLLALFPSVGDAVLLGELNRSEPWSLDITPGTAVILGTAVAVFGLTESSIKVLEVIRTTPASPQASVNFGSLGQKIRRISIDVSLSRDESYEIRITQGANVILFDAVGDVVIVLDLVP